MNDLFYNAPGPDFLGPRSTELGTLSLVAGACDSPRQAGYSSGWDR